MMGSFEKIKFAGLPESLGGHLKNKILDFYYVFVIFVLHNIVLAPQFC